MAANSSNSSNSTNSSSDRRIVVGYDGSEDALSALQWAVEEATQARAGLLVVACIDPRDTGREGACPPLEPVQSAASRLLAISGPESPPGDFQLLVARDVPWTRLVVESAGSGMLVIGTSSHLLLGVWRLGAITHELLRHATIPVTLVPRHASSQHRGRIVVAVDGTTSGTALAWAAQRSEDRACELVVVHGSERPVGAPGPTPDRVLSDACRDAERLTNQRVIPRLVDGPITTALLAPEFHTDLLVLGTGGVHHAGQQSGSVARAIAAGATGPTVMLRQPPRSEQ